MRLAFCVWENHYHMATASTSSKTKTQPRPAPKKGVQDPAVKKPVAKAKNRAAKIAAVKKTTAKQAIVKKRAPKKSTAKKPAAKKLASKNLVTKSPTPKSPAPKKITPSKPTAKKAIVKKAVIKKAALKKTVVKKPAAKKALVQKTARKTTLAKNPVRQKTPANDLTLQDKLEQVEARLKRAHATTRKNVKALEHLVTNLQAQSKTARTTQKAAFTRQVNALNKKLTGLMSDSQTEIAKDLSSAMNSNNITERLETIEAALTRADERLEQTEISQAEAIAKINRHLANLAKALETRFETETAQREAAIAKSAANLQLQSDAKLDNIEKTLQDKTENLADKINTIETDTAAALEGLGGKIENFASELDQRQIRINTNISEKIAEITLNTQAEFETLRSDVTRNIADISSRSPANNLGGPDQAHLDRQMHLLQGRLENLEQYLADIKLQPAPHRTEATPPPPFMKMESIPAQPGAPVQAIPMPQQHMPGADISNVVPITDAFAPVSTAPNPYAAAPNVMQQSTAPVPAPVTAPVAAPAPTAENNMPVEFDPAAYQQAMSAPHTAHSSEVNPAAASPAYAPIIPQAVTTPPPILPPTGSNGEYNPQDLTGAQSYDPFNYAHSDNAEGVNVENISTEPALPYADPAYAENDTMRAERIGETGEKTRKNHGASKFNLSKLPISGRNLKLLLMGGALTVLTLFAVKMVIGGDDKFAPVIEQTATVTQQDSNPFATVGSENDVSASLETTENASFTAETQTQAPIGKYVENTAPIIDANAAVTLGGAADSGNPAAQYQLGMSRLEAGDTQAGVKLIREAAAQNLPAAQYRLAKLYEIGQGVERDEVQARQLTERAAKSGHRIAMHDLALYYTDGRGGVDVNVSIAAGWFEQAAQFGVVDSQFNLAVLAESGQGIAQDLNAAYFWYNIAAKQGDQFAQKRIPFVKEGLSPEQIDAADARIAAFTPRPVNAEVNGVFRNTSTQNVKVEQIRQAQSFLAELGYDVGAPDGAMGPRTRAAITEFEKANTLPETGVVDETLLDRLELAVGA